MCVLVRARASVCAVRISIAYQHACAYDNRNKKNKYPYNNIVTILLYRRRSRGRVSVYRCVSIVRERARIYSNQFIYFRYYLFFFSYFFPTLFSFIDFLFYFVFRFVYRHTACTVEIRNPRAAQPRLPTCYKFARVF